MSFPCRRKSKRAPCRPACDGCAKERHAREATAPAIGTRRQDECRARVLCACRSPTPFGARAASRRHGPLPLRKIHPLSDARQKDSPSRLRTWWPLVVGQWTAPAEGRANPQADKRTPGNASRPRPGPGGRRSPHGHGGVAAEGVTARLPTPVETGPGPAARPSPCVTPPGCTYHRSDPPAAFRSLLPGPPPLPPRPPCALLLFDGLIPGFARNQSCLRRVEVCKT